MSERTVAAVLISQERYQAALDRIAELESAPRPSFDVAPLQALRAQVRKTWQYPGRGTASNAAISYATLALCGEAGELANKVKKILRGDYPSATSPVIYQQLIDELGDVLWYVDAIAAELGQPLEVIIRRNIEKLNARLSAGTIKGEGDNR